MSRFPSVIVSALLASAARPATAQRMEPAAVTHRVTPGASADFRDLQQAAASHGTDPATRAVVRTLTGALGFAGGAAILLGAYASTGPHYCTGDEGCLGDALSLLILGGVGGSGLGAALPNFGAECSLNARIWRGLGGSAGGFVAGLVAVPLGPFILAPIGAGLALIGC